MKDEEDLSSDPEINAIIEHLADVHDREPGGRECDCEEFHSMDGIGYLCKRKPGVNGFKCVQYRCIIKETDQ